MNETEISMNTTEDRPKRVNYSQRYIKELMGSMILYALALILRRYGLEHHWWPLGFTLLPAVPLTLAIVAMLRMIGKLDEFQRQIQLYSVAIAAMGTAFVSVVLGLLEDVGVGPVSIWVVWPLIGGLWAATSCFLSWRYCRISTE
jgi:hypothetical protein